MCFNRMNPIMPQWFPWIFIGGVVFFALSFIGAKFQDKHYKSIQFFQDFISGAILVGFLGVLAPDMFPKMDIPSFSLPSSIGGVSDSSDFDLQVGPPRLIGR
jgi:hypothetical protein